MRPIPVSVILAALAATTLAQSTVLDQLPEQCKTAVKALTEDSEIASCIGLNNLDSLALLYLGQSSDSIVAPISRWVSGVCSAPACSDDKLSKIVVTLTTSCGVPVPSEIITYYPTIRKAICLQEDSTNCIVKTLSAVEKAVGSVLSVPEITTISEDEIQAVALANKTELYCNDCVKGVYNTLAVGIPEIARAGYAPLLQEQCGASFIDGTVPSTVVAAASTSNDSPNTKSGAPGSESIIARGLLLTLTTCALAFLSI